MQVLRLKMKEGIPLGKFAGALQSISRLYSIFSVAYSSEVKKDLNFEFASGYELQIPPDSLDSSCLYVADVTRGSINIDLTGGLSEALQKLIDWLRDIIDPKKREKIDLENETLKIEFDIKKQKYLFDEQKYDLLIDEFTKKMQYDNRLRLIDVRSKQIALVGDALKVFDALQERGFSDKESKDFFFAALQEFGNLRQFQEQTKGIISTEIVEISD